MTDLAGATTTNAPVNIFDPKRPPSADTGIPGTAWAWNAERGRWVRSYAAFSRQQTTQPTPEFRFPVTQGSSFGQQIPTPTAAEQASARAIIRDFLQQFDLGGLENLLYEELVTDQDFSETRMMTRIRETPEYARRFPGMAARRAAGLPAISEEQYLADETAYRQILRNAGMPTGFYDSPDDFGQFIANDVSPQELNFRVQQGYQAVAQADPSVRNSMRQFYGVTDGELAAYFLDPERASSLIEQQVATARIGAAAARQGFGQVADRAAAERMQRLGVTEQEASQAFGTLSQARELLTPLERGETALDVAETALSLTGRGGAEAAQRLATQQRRRVARFEGGGRFATTGQEVTGLRTT